MNPVPRHSHNGLIRAIESLATLALLFVLPAAADAQMTSGPVAVRLVAYAPPGARLEALPAPASGDWRGTVGKTRLTVNTPYSISVREGPGSTSRLLLVSHEPGEVSWDVVVSRLEAADRVGSDRGLHPVVLDVVIKPLL